MRVIKYDVSYCCNMSDNTHENENDASFYCVDCGQKFRSREELIEHKSNRNRFDWKE
jgi:predicted RNA-binding Zn-ribbon protein involved in translation (DUF1610 family)